MRIYAKSMALVVIRKQFAYVLQNPELAECIAQYFESLPIRYTVRI